MSSWQSIDYEIMISTTTTTEKCMPVLPSISGTDMDVLITSTASFGVCPRSESPPCMISGVCFQLSMYHSVDHTYRKCALAILELKMPESFRNSFGNC
jgi:hypothetical protein